MVDALKTPETYAAALLDYARTTTPHRKGAMLLRAALDAFADAPGAAHLPRAYRSAVLDALFAAA